jgi:hypothetical protein
VLNTVENFFEKYGISKDNCAEILQNVVALLTHYPNLQWRLARILHEARGVSFAWSPCLRWMKIGATRKEHPQVKLQQLSRYVTSPFILAVWLPTPTPFRHEAETHHHFGAKRSMAPSAGTEFFHVVAEETVAYVGGV